MLYLQRCLLFYIHTKKNQTNSMRSFPAETCIKVVGLKMYEIYPLWVKFAKVMGFLSIT
jgi:hypothetical protein